MQDGCGERVEVTWGRAVEVWWALLWRFLVLAAGPSLLFASVSGGIVAFLFVPYLAKWVVTSFFLVGTTFLSIPVVKWILEVVILDGFAVRLVTADGNPGEKSAPDGRAASDEERAQ